MGHIPYVLTHLFLFFFPQETIEPYNFALQVNDDEWTNYQQRTESQDNNGVVQGAYSWVAPNGVRYTTTYTADAINGFQVQYISLAGKYRSTVIINRLLEDYFRVGTLLDRSVNLKY